jgi:hypothetical protein
MFCIVNGAQRLLAFGLGDRWRVRSDWLCVGGSRGEWDDACAICLTKRSFYETTPAVADPVGSITSVWVDLLGGGSWTRGGQPQLRRDVPPSYDQIGNASGRCAVAAGTVPGKTSMDSTMPRQTERPPQSGFFPRQRSHFLILGATYTPSRAHFILELLPVGRFRPTDSNTHQPYRYPRRQSGASVPDHSSPVPPRKPRPSRIRQCRNVTCADIG